MKYAPDTELTPHFNRLSPDVAERLTLLAEEAAEVILAVSKIKRHGLQSRWPVNSGSTNREVLEKEIGHFELILVEMISRRDVDPLAINDSARAKRRTINSWLHHNNVKP